MKMSIKTALAVLFALFAANIVAEAQIVWPNPGMYQGTPGYSETRLRTKVRDFAEEYIQTPPNCFTEEPNCQYGPWHPVGFQYHAVQPIGVGGSPDPYDLDPNCIVLVKFWIREKFASSELTFQVAIVEFDLYYLNNNGAIGTLNQCDVCREKFLQDMLLQKLNIKRAVGLLTLSPKALIDDPWIANQTWRYEISVPLCVGRDSNGDKRITTHIENYIDSEGIYHSVSVNDDLISTGIHTSNVLTCWERCCKRKITVRKRYAPNKIESSFEKLGEIELGSDEGVCQDACVKGQCGDILDMIPRPFMGGGLSGWTSIDFYKPPHYSDALLNDGWHSNAGSITQRVPTLSEMNAGIVYDQEPIPEESSTLNPSTVSLSPNPASNAVMFNINSTDNGACVLDIYNTYNVILLSYTFNKTSSSFQYNADISELPNGVYVYRLRLGYSPNFTYLTGTFAVVK